MQNEARSFGAGHPRGRRISHFKLSINSNMPLINRNCNKNAQLFPFSPCSRRIVVDLVYEMKRRDAKKGLATLCIGGGQGVAMCFEAA